MKNLVLSMLAIASITAMNSCSSENDPINEVDNGKDPIAITFGQNIEIYTKAPILDGTLANGSKIGLWATEYTDPNYTWKVDNKCNNSELTVSATGIDFTTPAYYSKIEGTKYDFYAYTPYADASNGLTVNAAAAGTAPSIDVTLKSAPADQIDLMYATPLMSQSPKKEAYELAFNHALAQVKFTVKTEEGVDLKTLTEISVQTASKSTMSLVDGSFTASTQDIAITPLVTSDPSITLSTRETSAGAPIMVFPENDVIDKVTFTIDDKEYTFNPTAVTLTQGKITTIDVTITATGLKFSQKINQWTDDNNHGSGSI